VLSLETEAVAISASVSAGSALLFETHPGLGRGKNSGLEPLSNPGVDDAIIPELVRPILGRCTPGSGSGWAWDLSAKLWQRGTCVEGDCDLEGSLDRNPLSETVSLLHPWDPPDLLLHFSSDGLLNFRCIVSMKLSLFAFFLASLDEDFPHHGGMVMQQTYRKAKEKKIQKWRPASELQYTPWL
jgi:hypothetical protein